MSSLHNNSSSRFPNAHVCVFSSRRSQPLRKSKQTWTRIAVSHNLYWKEAYVDDYKDALSLLDFRDANCLEISRLKDGSSWKDVEETVKARESNGNQYVIVPGSFRGPAGWKRKVKLELMVESVELRNSLLEKLRARIAPQKLIRERIKAFAAHIHSTASVEERIYGIESALSGVGPNDNLEGLVVQEEPSEEVVTANSRPFHPPQGTLSEKLIDGLSALPDQMQKLEDVLQWNTHVTGAVGAATTVVKLVDKAEKVAHTAQHVADISRSFAGVSSVFSLIALSARLISMYSEAERGLHVLPKTLDRILHLLGYVLRSLAHMLNPMVKIEVLHEEFAFNVLEKTFKTMGLIETQLLRGWLGRFLHSKVVKEIESIIEELEHKVVTVSMLTKPEKESNHPTDEQHHSRPERSAFFVGRTQTLMDLKCILRKYGSAVIAQMGGVGKTELMIALAQCLESERTVPGKVFWVTVDGQAVNVVESLAGLVDKFRTRKMLDIERNDPKFVVGELKRCLSERKGRWLLCLDNADNADNAEVSGILDTVCAIAKPTEQNGWVVVTSRQGLPRFWPRRKNEQKIELQPLSLEEGMILLWRQIHVIEAKDSDDKSVMEKINKMKENKPKEYDALKKLCGHEEEYSLGCLPLALVQAGTYMGRFQCSFSEYLKLLKEAKVKTELSEIFEKIQQFSPVRETQRSILTTWRISVNRLSSKAFEVLRSMSMLGPGRIPEALIKLILENAADEDDCGERMFRNVLMRELVHGSSLVYREKSSDSFAIHRLVRRFVLADMERESAVWNKSYENAFLAGYTQIGNVLENEGRSFDYLPGVLDGEYQLYLSHSLRIIGNCGPSNYVIRNAGLARKLYEMTFFTVKVLEFSGRVEEVVSVCQRVLKVFRNFRGYQEVGRFISGTLFFWGNSLECIGMGSDSLSYFEESLRIEREIYSRESSHHAIAFNSFNVGMLLEKLGKFDEAEEKLLVALEMWEKIVGRNVCHPEVARVMDSLGSVYQSQDKVGSAIVMFSLSLGMKRQLLGENTNLNDVAHALSNLGSLFEKQGRWSEAELVYKELLKMFRKMYGCNSKHRNIAKFAHSLGHVYWNQDKLGEAESILVECLEIYREMHANDDDNTWFALTLILLGNLYMRQENWDKTDSTVLELLEVNRRTLTCESRHSRITRALKCSYNWYISHGKRTEFELLIPQHMELFKETVKDDDDFDMFDAEM